MSLIEIVLLLVSCIAIAMGLKLAILIHWHFVGLRWPEENLESFVKNSPRFEHVTGPIYRDTMLEVQICLEEEGQPSREKVNEHLREEYDEDVEIRDPQHLY